MFRYIADTSLKPSRYVEEGRRETEPSPLVPPPLPPLRCPFQSTGQRTELGVSPLLSSTFALWWTLDYGPSQTWLARPKNNFNREFLISDVGVRGRQLPGES